MVASEPPKLYLHSSSAVLLHKYWETALMLLADQLLDCNRVRVCVCDPSVPVLSAHLSVWCVSSVGVNHKNNVSPVKPPHISTRTPHLSSICVFQLLCVGDT